MTIRSHLFVLTLVILLPIVLFGIGATALIADRERTLFEDGARQRTLALLTAVDTDLQGHMASLRGLASSYALQIDDLQTFHRRAQRTLRTQPAWRTVIVSLPSGERLLSASEPFGADLPPIVDRAGFEEVLAAEEPVIGDLVREPDGDYFAVRMPVTSRANQYIVAVLVDPLGLVALLERQRLPSDWVGVVIDERRNIVARTVDQSRLVGRPASESLQAALAAGAEGWFRGATIDGTPVYTPFNRSDFSGWTVAMGIPVATVETAAGAAVGMLALGLTAAVAAALLLAAALSHRIAAPIASLAAAARALGRGEEVLPPSGAGVGEVRDVSRALVTAAQAVNEREDKLKAADEAKNEFLAMLGHELRNPLGALASAVEVLKSGTPASPTAAKATAVVGRQVEHMTRLVDDLLDVGRVTSGKVQLSLGHLDLAELTREVVQGLRAAELFAGHEVEIETSPVWIHGDATRIEQIITNLVENAVKFTPKGGRIHVRVGPRDGGAALEVEDSGIGLSPELASRVFDLFYQGERSLDRRIGGLGIGLTLVKRLTELHGGSVLAEPVEATGGSRFTITLPAVPAAVASASGTEATPVVAAERSVLIVEDNEDARQTLAAALEFLGYRVSEAADGGSGLTMALESRPDIAILDIGLPVLDGYEVARRLRTGDAGGADESAASPLLIAVTGYGDPGAARRALDAGFDFYLTKPASPQALAAIIEDHFRQPRPHEPASGQ